MTDEQRERWKENCLRWCERIDQLVRLDAPDCVVAHAIVSLHQLAIGYITDDMLAEMNTRLRDSTWMIYKRCLYCGADVEKRSRDELCDKCTAKEAAASFRDEMEDDQGFDLTQGNE